MSLQKMLPDVKASPSPPLSTAGGRPVLPIGIAVMGATGSGKTSFINIASGSDLRVGKNLRSCTTEVQLANDFTLDGRRVILIDTPGFNDTSISDAEILRRIAAFLAVTYKEGSKLAGIIYIHPISDDRFGGISVRNFDMFQKLCGNSTLKNVILMTNKWGRVEKDDGEAREKELAEEYFAPALEMGAQLTRHYHTTQSAQEIIRRIMKNDPAPLLIQQELVDEGKDIKDTSAGGAVDSELIATLERNKAEMVALREEMRKALERKDSWMKKELEKESHKLKVQMDEMRAERETMTAKFDQEKKNMEEMPWWSRCIVM